MDNITASSPHPKKSVLTKALIVAFVLGVVGLIIFNLPRGYSRDLAQIGKGKNVVVQVHDHNLVGSIDLMENLNGIRAEYNGTVEFVVADLQVPEGQAFADTYRLEAPTLVFFAPDGAPRGTVQGVQDSDALRNTLNQAFGLPAQK